jgi:hypothetical protein
MIILTIIIMDSRAGALVQLAEFIGLSALGGPLRRDEAEAVLRANSFETLKRSGVRIVAKGGAPGALKLRRGAARAFSEYMDEETILATAKMMRGRYAGLPGPSNASPSPLL